MKLGELFFDLGIKSGNGSATLRDFMGKMSSLRMTTLGAAGAITGIGAALAGTIVDTSNAAIGFQTFASATGLAWRELQQWQMVGERANVPAEAMTAAVTKLQAKLIQLQLRGEGAGIFNLLGVEPVRATETFHVLEKLMGAYSRMPAGVFANVAAGLGLDPVLTNLFAKGPGWFAQQTDATRGLGMTAEEQRAALKFMEDYKALWQEIRTISFSIGALLMPIAEAGLEKTHGLAAWVKDMITPPEAVDPKHRTFKESLMYKWFVDANPPPPPPPGGTRGTVDVKITGDAQDAAFAHRVAEEVAKIHNSTEPQIKVPEAQ